jgi:predicted site-specific integrase-resolvase
LINPDATLSRLRAAEALGIAHRTVDRWVADKKLVPIGAGLRKRFKVEDLQRLLNQKLSDKSDNK